MSVRERSRAIAPAEDVFIRPDQCGDEAVRAHPGVEHADFVDDDFEGLSVDAASPKRQTRCAEARQDSADLRRSNRRCASLAQDQQEAIADEIVEQNRMRPSGVRTRGCGKSAPAPGSGSPAPSLAMIPAVRSGISACRTFTVCSDASASPP